MDIAEYGIIALVGFFSGIIKTGVGVGAGIFLLPTLALTFPVKVALGLGAPLMLVSDVVGLRYYWGQWLPRADLGRLFLAALPGLILGIVLLPLIPGGIFRVCVGLFGFCYALGLLWPHFPATALLKRFFGRLDARCADRSSAGAYIYGFLGGLSSVLAHAGGLVWSLYLLTAAPDRRIFVGTTIVLFFVTNIYKTASYLYIDIIDIHTLMGVLPAIPMILLGSYVGNMLNKKCNHVLFKKIVLVFIMITSITLCI